MPPTRTIPPAKVMKTERTHEENQERAYIAASRRSDRSLEARVESARRASEIHKRRTGRSLRVTEQDVINEEMYEEEDDDLPLQYRRLTAHLQTGSADFNRRLAAYLTNQVAMRSAVGNMVNNPFAQQQFPLPGGYPPGMMPPQQSPQSVPQSPGSYRQAPYPSPHHPGYRPAHGRAYSTALPPKSNTPPIPAGSMDHRRMSTPAATAQAPPPIQTDGVRSDAEYLRQTQSAQIPGPFAMNPWFDSPFSATLPPESQQMLAGALDPHDPYNQMLLHGSENLTTNPYYPWGDMQGGIKGMPVHPSAYPGMTATLAPAALETKPQPSVEPHGTPDHPSHMDSDIQQVKREGSHDDLNSGQMSPVEGFWDHFVQDDGWQHEEPTASQ